MTCRIAQAVNETQFRNPPDDGSNDLPGNGSAPISECYVGREAMGLTRNIQCVTDPALKIVQGRNAASSRQYYRAGRRKTHEAVEAGGKRWVVQLSECRVQPHNLSRQNLVEGTETHQRDVPAFPRDDAGLRIGTTQNNWHHTPVDFPGRMGIGTYRQKQRCDRSRRQAR